ncbi:hypothetical protein [Planomicrobium sp. MB-3u-38]|uniref:hypothetical protein n=1 Tax=Planomicrobium sp. MB-3u-38 TaxID=2058318 RepID=UPI000C7BFCA6|nr:hypothetical protein [Planomicrobium sp. MB-3u-38]PKH09869.1 hypothetical protein CXF70_11700 [Planomicrobium sp. MB-3u-38]
MINRDITRLDMVKGATVLRQGHFDTLAFTPRNSEGEVVDLSGKVINVKIIGQKGIVYETSGSFNVTDSTLQFSISENIGHGEMWMEITVTDPADATYRQKFPTSEYEGKLFFIRSSDDLDYVGFSGKTVAQFEAAQTEFTNKMQQDFDVAVAAVTQDSEVALARMGEASLRAFNQKTTEKLADKAEKEEVRLNTDIQPINVNEMDTETKQLFTGGAVAVVGLNAVGSENVKPKAITPEKLSYSELLSNFEELNLPQGQNYLTQDGFTKEVGHVILKEPMIASFVKGANVDYISFTKSTRFPNAVAWPNKSMENTMVLGEFDKGEVRIINNGWDRSENAGYHAKNSTTLFLFITKDRFATEVAMREYFWTNPIGEVYYSLAVPEVTPYPYDLSANTKSIIDLKTLPEIDFSEEFAELDLPQGRNSFTADGFVKEVGRTLLKGDIVSSITRGTNVDLLVISKTHFPNADLWPGINALNTSVTGEFDNGEFELVASNWDDIARIGWHTKNANNLYLVTEKNRFLMLDDAKDFVDNANIEVFYTLSAPAIVPYPENMANITKETIKLMVRTENAAPQETGSKLYENLPINKVTEYENQNVLEVTHDGVVYCYEGLTLQKTVDFITFETLHTFPNGFDYVFKLQNGSIFVVLDNGSIWLSDETEGNFQLLTSELSGQGHHTNTSRAYVYNNILLVGEYKLPVGSLGNKVFISTDYGKTFKISLLPEQLEVIDHTHSIVYDPYEQLIWVATGDKYASQRIYWTRDFGDTWETHAKGRYRMTTIIPLPDCVLFGTDEEEVIGTYKYERQSEGVTPANFVAHLDFKYLYAPGEYIFGWTSQPSIVHNTASPYAYFGSRISHDYTSVGTGKIGVFKTDGKDYYTLWEFDGGDRQTPYGVSSVHGPDKNGRVFVFWIDNTAIDGEKHRTIVFE